MKTAGRLIREAKAILLDFDGPLTILMPPPSNAEAAEAARAALGGYIDVLPSQIATTTDHLAVLRYSAVMPIETLQRVEDACVKAEAEAARTSQPTLGAHELLKACANRGKPVVIVSNNSAEAVHTYLNRFRLHSLVRAVIGRQPRRPDLMKPHPSLVAAALDLLDIHGPKAVLVGDAITDVQAAHTGRVRAIGYAKTLTRGHELALAGADALTEDMGALAEALLN